MTVELTSFHEETAEPKTQALPLSHLSIEVGHLYTEDYDRSDAALVADFRRLAGWLDAVTTVARAELAPARPRISTCFLIDDYYGRLAEPAQVMPRLLGLMAEAGLSIDYIARESAAAGTGEVELAELVLSRLVAEPAPGTDGRRPPTRQTGWLSNGRRTPAPGTVAMAPEVKWLPPKENADNAHSIFLDVELWSDTPHGRRWACPYLAAVWQLLRLGLLRDRGRAVAVPSQPPPEWPPAWGDLPAVMAMGDRAAPFTAYRTISIMDSRFIRVEHAVRTILGSVAPEAAVSEQLAARVAGERLAVAEEIVDRIEYVFTSPTAWRR